MNKCKDCQFYDDSTQRVMVGLIWGTCRNRGPFMVNSKREACVSFKKKGDNNHV